MEIFAILSVSTAASAATTDIKEQRIPNKLVFPLMLIGLFGHLLTGGLDGLIFAAAGWGAGLLIFMIPFAICMMGAGDVKLMAVIGSLMGWRFVLVTALYTSMAGLFVALAILTKKRGWIVRLLRYLPIRVAEWLLPKVTNRPDILYETIEANELETKERPMVPYGLCIFMGVLAVLIGQQFSGWPLIDWIN